MKYKDYYQTLGVQRTASEAEIKAAYRKLARKYHPDVSKQGDAENRFKELGEAYAVLKDPEKRAAYDGVGDRLRDGQEFQAPPRRSRGSRGAAGAGATGAMPGADESFSDFFEAMFNQNRGARPDPRSAYEMAGEDHHAKVVIDLEDSYIGARRSIEMQAPAVDAKGRMTMQSRTLDVSIPKGIRAGQKLRLTGQGGASPNGGRAGDLYLEIAFRESSRFQVDDRDVTLELPVAPWELALGAQVTVPTPDGSVDMTIPPNSSNGQRLRLKGKGLPGKPPGEFYVKLMVVLPPADSAAVQSAYDALKQASRFDPRARFNAG
jgi:curved DNA-binding protein